MTEIVLLGVRGDVKGVSASSRNSLGKTLGINRNDAEESGKNFRRGSYSAKYLAKREQIETNLKLLQDTIQQQQNQIKMHLKQKKAREVALEERSIALSSETKESIECESRISEYLDSREGGLKLIEDACNLKDDIQRMSARAEARAVVLSTMARDQRQAQQLLQSLSGDVHTSCKNMSFTQIQSSPSSSMTTKPANSFTNSGKQLLQRNLSDRGVQRPSSANPRVHIRGAILQRRCMSSVSPPSSLQRSYSASQAPDQSEIRLASTGTEDYTHAANVHVVHQSTSGCATQDRSGSAIQDTSGNAIHVLRPQGAGLPRSVSTVLNPPSGTPPRSALWTAAAAAAAAELEAPRSMRMFDLLVQRRSLAHALYNPQIEGTGASSSTAVSLTSAKSSEKSVGQIAELLLNATTTTVSNKVEEACCICLDLMELDQSVCMLNCTHRIHRPCLKLWLLGKSSTVCPLCKCSAKVSRY
ncbi:hypothetical protein CEUSTIGMA_g3302.t1 [Chlamydomonas eustigma]|uniref:RING-type domain-containing protein n=1 Tax=Chlamydomonas eustigma TaxID=1157962 RepID=A0A250WYT5_9CHLO|nr:hypothetical protein CEUSTIGMA_g3302.t1 [Chlamydomonas eustigma]|eukprot:GAX75859.1 hypothetical protein CEUSTIGMA_g3302.t1 [Chlamydomonas eustigma]